MRRRPEEAELQLLPFMNLMTLLIPFLLASAQFANLSVIDTQLPSIAPERAAAAARETLQLALVLDADGCSVHAELDLPRSGELEPGLRSERFDGCDADALSDYLADVKYAYPAETSVRVSASDDVPYERFVAALDVSRGEAGELFPQPLVSALLPR